MPNLSLVAWEIRRTSAGKVAPRACPRCRRTGQWSAVRERRRLQVLGTGVGRGGTRDLIACGGCGCSMPAGWRAAQVEPAARPVPA